MFRGSVYVVHEALPREQQPLSHFIFQELDESILSLLAKGRIVILFSNLSDADRIFWQIADNDEYSAAPYLVRGGHNDVLFYVLGTMRYIEDTSLEYLQALLRNKFLIDNADEIEVVP